MSGDAVDTLPPGLVATDADDAAALHVRLQEAKARMAQTLGDSSAAQQTILAFHFVATANAGGEGRAPSGPGTRGGNSHDACYAKASGSRFVLTGAARSSPATVHGRAAIGAIGAPTDAADALLC